ncbi:hypothetical protein P3T20_002268 [Paraburkholderia sp. GAS206C]|jgi:hypothetical protein|uniref:hypothetical protein n=1 Tax=unclassified Paraburkholderia TaxID=2615204 RepID=UPI003D1ACB11
MQLKEPISFQGEFDVVEGGEFKLETPRFIVAPDRLSFELIGEDQDGKFRAFAVASPVANLKYKSIGFETHYEQWPGQPTIGTLEFACTLDRGLTKCEVEGVWTQGRGRWVIEASLERFQANRS